MSRKLQERSSYSYYIDCSHCMLGLRQLRTTVVYNERQWAGPMRKFRNRRRSASLQLATNNLTNPHLESSLPSPDLYITDGHLSRVKESHRGRSS